MKNKIYSSFECDIFWGGVDWKTTPPRHLNQSSNPPELDAMLDCDDSIFESLNAFYNKFYPYEQKDEVNKVIARCKEHINKLKKDKNNQEKIDATSPLSFSSLPWIAHKATQQFYSSDTNNYKKALKKKLKENWLLSWHWRALLPSIINWDEQHTEEKFILQICQIRNWELSLTYKATFSMTALDNCNSFSDFYDLIDNKKTLLRPPIFGKSHRIFRWDVYRHYYNPLVKKHIKKEYDTHDDDFKNSYILGRNDCYYIIQKIAKPKKNKPTNYKLKCHYLINLHPELSKYEIKDIDNNSITIDFSNPQDLVKIPTFKKDEKDISLLLSSDNYCDCFQHLTESMNDPLAKSLLLHAPSGSGKEMLANSSYLCRDNRGDSWIRESRGRFISTSLAGLNPDEVAKILFSLDNTDNITDGKTIDLSNNYTGREKDGLFFKSIDGALFIDEIDKVSPEVRNMFLRVLESREITIPGLSLVVRVPKKRVPFYIFTCSEEKQKLLGNDEFKPNDFWTRVSHFAEMKHPLKLEKKGKENIEEFKRMIISYIWLFWVLQTKDYIKNKKLLFDDYSTSYRKEMYKPLASFFHELQIFLLEKPTIEFIAKILSQKIIDKGSDKTFSIRTLKYVAGRTIFKLIDELLYSKSEISPIEKLKQWRDTQEPPLKTPKDWFRFLSDFISQYNKKSTYPKILPEKLEKDFFDGLITICADCAQLTF